MKRTVDENNPSAMRSSVGEGIAAFLLPHAAHFTYPTLHFCDLPHAKLESD
ncbi:MAG TPA: hypothetical protein VFE62_12650 [Gemmataceae bacterium]|nr:hypothetical protein [Gemmataceae bacterium]